MTERDLENLKHLAVPEARAEARRAALEAALNAFDTTESGSASNSESGPKENVRPLRLTETSKSKRSFLMTFTTRHGVALAASLTALLVAAPLAFRHMRGELDHTFNRVQTELAAANAYTGGSASGPASPSNGPPPAAVPSRTDLRALRGEPAPAKAKSPVTAAAVTAPAGKPAATPPPPAAGDNTYIVDNNNDVSSNLKFTRKAQIAPGQAGSADSLGKASVGKQAMGADSSGLSYDPGTTMNSGDRPRAPAAAAPAVKGEIAHLNAETGRRLIESDKYAAERDAKQPHDPYAWMGHADEQRAIALEENRDKFEAKEPSPVKQAANEPVSTFSIDVDTASYSFARRALNAGHLPPKDSVRVEEMINYFPYNYPVPESAETPFKPTVTVMPSPWNANNKLVHIAIKGYDLKAAERPRANIVLLMDVSGSMAPTDRLPLVKNAFRMLVDQLRPDDTVGIVTYASGSGIALEPTKVADKRKIIDAIDRLGAGGSTAGAQGIQDAYRLAEAGFDKSAVNRIILATDGDFNVGITDPNELKSYIERKRQSGIFLSILGVGQGNHNDALMQTLAQNGNGTAAYVDTLNEARKVLVDETSSTLFTIAKDVKVQIEWNPSRVAEYRLIGYETRALKREDFNNDKVDAGDIGSGHTVTAIYEVTPVGSPKMADDLRYGAKTAAAEPPRREPADASSAELGFLKLRYKRPNEDTSQLMTLPITDGLERSTNLVRTDAPFSIAVAAFGQLLKGDPNVQGFTYDDVLIWAGASRGDDPFGYRAEFLNLVRLAKSARP
jgi:Ca-activated chloride channel homolog